MDRSIIKKLAFSGALLCFLISASGQSQALAPADLQELQEEWQCLPIPLPEGPFKQDIISAAKRIITEQASFDGLVLIEHMFANVTHVIREAAILVVQARIASNVDKYVFSVDELTLKGSAGGKVLLFVDKNDANWFVRDMDRPGFFQEGIPDYYATELINGVVASHIHSYLAQEEATEVAVKFLVGGKPGDRVLFGTARHAKAFQPFWGVPQDCPVLKFSNAEKEIAIWQYLGLPLPSDAFSGFDRSTREKVLRVDFHNAFTSSRELQIKKHCVETSDFPIDEYECDVEKVKTYLAEFASEATQAKVAEIIDVLSQTLEELGITGYTAQIQSAKFFLKAQTQKIRDFLKNAAV